MKLVLQKDQQQKGMMSKTTLYILRAKAELSKEGKENIDKYKAGNTVLYSNMSESDLNSGLMKTLAKAATSINMTVNDLASGKTFEAKDIMEVMYIEEQIKTACLSFKELLEAMASFGGEEVFEF